MITTLCAIAVSCCWRISPSRAAEAVSQPGADYRPWRAGLPGGALSGWGWRRDADPADDDAVHLSNLQRQILFTSADIDRPKAAAAKTRLSQLNPQIKLVALQQRLSGEALRAEVAKADVVLDCTDNMVTRRAINAACVALDIPLVTASAVGFGGQLMVLTPGRRAAIAACGRIATNRSATAAPRGSSARWSA